MDAPLVPTGYVPRTIPCPCEGSCQGLANGAAHGYRCTHPQTRRITVKESNPKEAIGSTKLDMSLVPSSAVAFLASAFTEGALKYGSYNWRVAGVRASTYIAACLRHIFKWWNGEKTDPATKVYHLANAMACLAIVLDAEVCKMLTDDRPPKADMAKLLDELGVTVAHLKEMSKDMKPRHNTALNSPPVSER